jgi:hypothetical protein
MHCGHYAMSTSAVNFQSLAERWLSNFLGRARRAERACPWGRIVDDAQLDCFGDATIAEMVELASDAAEAWSQITACLREYQQKRTAGAFHGHANPHRI